MLVGKKSTNSAKNFKVCFNDHPIELKNSIKYLRVQLDEQLSWKTHKLILTISLNIGLASILDWEGGKPQITCNDVIRNFQNRNFLWGKDIVE